MSIKISLPESFDMKPKITVFGVGGAGGNAVNNMISSNLEGVEFWVANTDAQALDHSLTNNRIQLGARATLGLGAGSHPEVGKQAAEESIDELYSLLENTNMVFITAGMGGGTGTGGAPVIAKAAKDKGILTVGVVTKPFHFEGARRMKVAELGLEELNRYVDTLIVIPNQNLFRIANENTTFADAFKMADDVLYSGVRGITDLITMPGLINLDFADIRTVISEMGKAMMGTGEDEGEDRAIKAAEKAISNPLLDNTSMKGARGVLINITGGSDMTLFQVDAAANRIREEVDPNANIIFGSAYNSDLEGKIRVSVVATGIDSRLANVNLRAQVGDINDSTSQMGSSINSRLHDTFGSNSMFNEVSQLIDNDDDLEENEEEQEDDSDSFLPPKPMELSMDANFGITSTLDADLPVSHNATPIKANNQDALNNEESNSHESTAANSDESSNNFKKKSKEDFFDIPAFIRKRMKF